MKFTIVKQEIRPTDGIKQEVDVLLNIDEIKMIMPRAGYPWMSRMELKDGTKMNVVGTVQGLGEQIREETQ